MAPTFRLVTQPADPGFVADVRRAAGVWSGNPTVPLTYLLLGLAYATILLLQPVPPEHCATKYLGTCPLPPEQAGRAALASFGLLPVLLFQIGLAGTARVWYARRFAGDADGDRVTPGEVWTLSWRFFGRFLRLGLLFAALTAPFVIVVSVIAISQDDRLVLLLGSAAIAFVADVVLTFATPGLALYNDRAVKAFTGGLKILRTAWPECALYALVPPLALLIVAQGNPQALGRPLSAALALVSPLLTLLFAGAAVSFVTRRWPPMGRDGSLAGARPWQHPQVQGPI